MLCPSWEYRTRLTNSECVPESITRFLISEKTDSTVELGMSVTSTNLWSIERETASFIYQLNAKVSRVMMT